LFCTPRGAALIGKEVFCLFSFSVPPLSSLSFSLRVEVEKGALLVLFDSIETPYSLHRKNMSGRAALEALVASPDALGVSAAHAAELCAGVRGVLRSTAGADGGDAETVRSKEQDQ